ncbi:MAG: LysR family transcriptional regulator [Spirochaetaceae bacterium]|jgi:lysyl-tRNA synthetase class 2|nr:LysR family transcriptional regulator [Spirochaetaceae bacterium]
MDMKLLRERARIIREVRAFFDRRDYLEVDTPLLAPDLIPESCLEVFETTWIPPRFSRREAEKYWLVPSPEIWMKKLIARHRTSMYQVCKCFRNTESRGHQHNPEFTMLEYYTMDADYLDSLDLTEELFRYLLEKTGDFPALRPPFVRITVEEAFQRWAGFSLAGAAVAGPEAVEAEARRLGLEPPPDLDTTAMPAAEAAARTAALYDLIFIHVVEPSLPRDRPAALLDYPAFVPCLAQNNQKPGAEGTKERWELYVNGIELANCYSEETKPEEIRRFFEAEGVEKQKNALVKHSIDGEYWKNFLHGFPHCSGVAMGLDRLIMAFTGKSAIDSVIPFSF